jgi:hypothetical protein
MYLKPIDTPHVLVGFVCAEGPGASNS